MEYMPVLKKAKEPFRFYTRLHLTELTGLRASNLSQLLGLIREVSDSCIYYHTHHFLQQHQYLSPEPPNDFAYWVREVLGEDELGERLASIDTIQFLSISNLREKIIATIQEYLTKNLLSKLNFVKRDEEFHFMKSISFVFQTDYVACDLRQFVEALRRITIDSIYFHIFEARLRLEKKTNDFSLWIETSIGDRELAAEISRLDPYTYAMEDLRKALIVMIEKRIQLI